MINKHFIKFMLQNNLNILVIHFDKFFKHLKLTTLMKK